MRNLRPWRTSPLVALVNETTGKYIGECQSCLYTWSRTWDDKPEDYACTDGDAKVGRACQINTLSEGGRFWTCNCSYGDRLGSYSGRWPTCGRAAPGRMKAAAVEAAQWGSGP